MSKCCCTSEPRRSVVKRGAGLLGWAVPGVVLALVPKCPMCVAGYIAVATGVGVSVSTASLLRTAVIASWAGAMLLLAVRAIHRRVRAA